MKKILALTVISMTFATACSDEDSSNAGTSDYISFEVSVTDRDENISRTSEYATIETLDAAIGNRQLFLHTIIDNKYPKGNKAKGAESRGLEIGQSDLTQMRVSAVAFDGTWGATDFNPQVYMSDILVEESSQWGTGLLWPNTNDSIRFYAHAPNVAGIKNAGSGSNVSFSYTVPGNIHTNDCSTVVDQKDLLVASAQYAGNYCNSAQLKFSHALAAVEIIISKEVTGFTLKSLKIDGLYDSGTFIYNSNVAADGCGYWSDVTSAAGTSRLAAYYVFPQTDEDGTAIESLVFDGSNKEDVEITDGDMLLLLMPQELPEDATISVTGVDDTLGKGITFSAKIGGTDANGTRKKMESRQAHCLLSDIQPYRHQL